MIRRPLLAALLVSPMSLGASMAAAQTEMRFPEASEAVPELIDLWNASNSICRGANGGDVKVAAACLSRSVYGVALNEREWCFGKEDEAGADMSWHECEEGSLRFPHFEIPEP